MRSDMQKLICERPRIGHSNLSAKTKLKVDPRQFNNNEDDYDVDLGSVFLSSSRCRQHGSKKLNENLRPLYKFLNSCTGRPWNDVYHEVREQIDARKAIGFHVLQHLHQYVPNNVKLDENGKPVEPSIQHGWNNYTGLYVNPETGILCKKDQCSYKKFYREKKKAEPLTKIHFKDNIFFELVVLKTSAKCGCVRFLHPKIEGKFGFYFRPGTKPAVCIHGNEPEARPIWYRVEYDYHRPDEIYKLISYMDWWHYNTKNGDVAIDLKSSFHNLMKPEETVTLYYRDVPTLLAKPFEISRKVVNKKDLKYIRKCLSQHQKIKD